jgi:hypothetical protein
MIRGAKKSGFPALQKRWTAPQNRFQQPLRGEEARMKAPDKFLFLRPLAAAFGRITKKIVFP